MTLPTLSRCSISGRSTVGSPASVSKRIGIARRQIGHQQRAPVRRRQAREHAHVDAAEQRAQVGEARVPIADDLKKRQLDLRDQAARRPRRRTAPAARRRRARSPRRRSPACAPAPADSPPSSRARSKTPDTSTGACSVSRCAISGAAAARAPLDRRAIDVDQVNLGERRRQRAPDRRRRRCRRRAGRAGPRRRPARARRSPASTARGGPRNAARGRRRCDWSGPDRRSPAQP